MNEHPQPWQTINMTDCMHPKLTTSYLEAQGYLPNLPERFWSKVRKTKGCWLWTGSKHVLGYGMISIRKHVNKASHRVSWTLKRGPIPDAMCVLHHCDNRCCVRPSHLFIGTQRDNIADMDKKGRRTVLRGENHGNAKLTSEQVRKIRSLRANGASLSKIASAFGVWFSNVSMICKRQTWQHLK